MVDDDSNEKTYKNTKDSTKSLRPHLHGGVLFEDSLEKSGFSEINFHEKVTLALVKELLIPDEDLGTARSSN